MLKFLKLPIDFDSLYLSKPACSGSMVKHRQQVDRRGLSKSCCVQTNHQYKVLTLQSSLKYSRASGNTLKSSVILKWKSDLQYQLTLLVSQWIVAVDSQFGWTRSSKHLLLNSPKWNPKLKLSSSPQLQAIITHPVTIMSQCLSSQHRVP